jgi:cysteine-rich repeat protein
MIQIHAYAAFTSFTLTLVTTAIVCGDGAIDGLEGCDDTNVVAGDGCSATCEVEVGFVCEGEPSVCTAIPVIGTFAAGAAIPDTTGGPLAMDEWDTYVITFTEDVLLDGTLTSDAGDPDYYFYNADETVFLYHAAVGPEDWTGDIVPAGTYMIDIVAYDAVGTYTLTLACSAP